MDLPISLQDITYAENYLAQGDLATATPLLERLVELAEEYIDAECKTEEKRQYFSFDSKFERLAYRRVEKDPRELVQVEVPFDRLYSDMAFAYIRQQDYVSARNALMQAVRWDPMNCNYRLDLAELFRALEDKQEWASLSFSVLERASDGKCAARAYANLGQYFLEPETENVSAAVGCARLALRLAPNDAHTTRLLNKIHTTYPDAADESDDHVMGELALQGVPTSPSAEIAICLIMCATDAASDGDKQEATRLTVRARDLVGEEACAAIIKLVRESDAELLERVVDVVHLLAVEIHRVEHVGQLARVELALFRALDEQLLELFVGVDELRRGERGDPLFIELLALFLLLRLLLRVLGQQLVGHGLEFLLAVVLFTHICFPP